MNRDIKKIILIDDDPDSFAGFERNTLVIKPFDNIRDKTDSILLDLIPLLQAMHDTSSDYRKTLEDLGTTYAEEAVSEYAMRVARVKEEERRRRNKGLGSLIRNKSRPEDVHEASQVRSLIPSPSSIVGEAPPETEKKELPQILSETELYKKSQKSDMPTEKKRGAVFQWFQHSVESLEESERAKMEKMESIARKRYEDKLKREKDARDKQRFQDEEGEDLRIL
jgi:hypothetical protein